MIVVVPSARETLRGIAAGRFTRPSYRVKFVVPTSSSRIPARPCAGQQPLRCPPFDVPLSGRAIDAAARDVSVSRGPLPA